MARPRQRLPAPGVHSCETRRHGHPRLLLFWISSYVISVTLPLIRAHFGEGRFLVDGDGGVEVVEVAGHGSTGVAESVDAVGQGFIGSDAGGDDLSPLLIEAVLQVEDFGSPPTVDALEALMEGLLAA